MNTYEQSACEPGGSEFESAGLKRLESLVDECQASSLRGDYHRAEALAADVIELDPQNATAHNNLGWCLQNLQRDDEAIQSYEKALTLDPELSVARRNLAIQLVKSGRREESLPYWRLELAAGEEGVQWVDQLIADAMEAEDLDYAGDLAWVFATVRWSLDAATSDDSALQPLTPVTHLSVNKLKHDIEQLRYLIDNNCASQDLNHVLREYESVLAQLDATQPDAHVALEEVPNSSIGRWFNRFVHLRQSPRQTKVFSDSWVPEEIEANYLNHHPGIVVIDDFLTPEVLEELQRFCLESTVWSANRYRHGRLGAFFREGFNTPLLRQIAEELRSSLPNVIGEPYPLRQLWGFKNTATVPGNSSIHADFAAVNVNFWITPASANLDPETGGMTIYEADAPADWDFHAYNARPDLIRSYLAQCQAGRLHIPYRENRAIIFNSDLFHETDEVNFKEGFENRRINITMLYGNRENDTHHARYPWQNTFASRGAWRSQSISRSRAYTRTGRRS